MDTTTITTSSENHRTRRTESRRQAVRTNAIYPSDDPKVGVFTPPTTRRRPHTDYVSAACLEVRDVTDEEACYEVMLLRLFAREYVEKLPDGAQRISDYHEKAPLVTRAIESHPAYLEIYVDLYERFIGRLIERIQYGRWEEAHETFGRMREKIENRFLQRDPTCLQGVVS
ncbi:MAG: hypothetical protein WA990_11535 [Rubrobacteraceae bacterium]